MTVFANLGQEPMGKHFVRRFGALTFVLILLGALLSISPRFALALDRGDMGEVSPTRSVVTQTFPAIVGQMAPNNNPPHPKGYNQDSQAQYTIPACSGTSATVQDTKASTPGGNAAAYCDGIKFRSFVLNHGVT